jgi:hypothetical protein
MFRADCGSTKYDCNPRSFQAIYTPVAHKQPTSNSIEVREIGETGLLIIPKCVPAARRTGFSKKDCVKNRILPEAGTRESSNPTKDFQKNNY